MTNEELDTLWIPAMTAVRALRVKKRIFYHWLDTGQIESRATPMTNRRWVSVASVRAFIRARAGQGSAEENMFNNLLQSEELPQSPFPERTSVLAS